MPELVSADLPFFYWTRDLTGKWWPVRSLHNPKTTISKGKQTDRVRRLSDDMRQLSTGVLSLIYPPPGIPYVGAAIGGAK